MTSSRIASCRWLTAALLLATGLLSLPAVLAQTTVCARVKIEIKQALTLERQAFDAEMKINNTTDTGVIENVAVELKVSDETGNPVPISDNPNDSSARFFVRVSNKANISAIDGSGAVAPMTTSTINWLLIPAPGSAGVTTLGKKYLVGATLKYKYGAELAVLDIAPAVITVKPLPLLTLDYFLPQDVTADDPLTPAIEAAEPFTLGVRVKNNGLATAKALKIDSAQPKIVENNQGLLINFLLTGSYVNDVPAQNTLLINFGDIPGGAGRMGRWNMETTLAGKFVEFTARFSHSDELGGALTSILQATNAHALIHDVRVDLPGRDYVRDFLARDGDVIRVYESDGPDTVVSDRSGAATLVAGATENGAAQYRLRFPPTAGFSYVRLADPFAGAKVPGKFMRSDAKQLSAENVWLSKTRNASTKQWEYWVNLFDVNSSGEYDSQFQPPPVAAHPPVMQFIPDRVAQEDRQVSFLVEASSPDGKPLTFAAAPLPVGARLIPQAAAAATPGLARAIFDWTPAKGSAGNYLITYSVSDGTLSAVRSADIRVEAAKAQPGPGIPRIASPLAGAQLTSLNAVLSVLTANEAQDSTSKVQFELYADEAGTQLVASALLDRTPPSADPTGVSVPVPTAWTVPDVLNNNTWYWWRARAFGGALFSPWAQARFFANPFNEPPDQFNLSSPANGASVNTRTPQLTWTNSKDRDGNAISYTVTVYRDAALTEILTESTDWPANASGSTSWRVRAPLADAPKYYWRVLAKDAFGARTQAAIRTFTIDTSKPQLPAPVPLSPVGGGMSATTSPVLTVNHRTDVEADGERYVFEIDTVNTFDSGNKRSSGPVAKSDASSTGWHATGLLEDQRYWWRVKLLDGLGESAWAGAQFLASTANHAPPAPTVKNPGNEAWTASLQPSLEANPVVDPEGDAVRYQFEVYRDDALTQKFGEGTSATRGWIMPAPLADGVAYWWRVRAVDTSDAASAWSAVSVFNVRSAPSQGLAIAVTSPVSLGMPELTGGRRQATIRWEGVDPNSTATVALYHSPTGGSFAGTRIVDGLRALAGAGGYVWDVSALAPGVYYVYAEIYDGSGVGRAYAPGAVVVPNTLQSGAVRITGPASWYEAGTATITVAWSGASGNALLLPLSGNAISTSSVALTVPAPNASGTRLLTMLAPYQCNREPSPFGMQLSPVATEDLNLVGRVETTNFKKLASVASNAGDESLRVCDIRIVAERKLDAVYSEYTVSAKLSNLGAAVNSANATAVPIAADLSVSGALEFFSIDAGAVANSRTTVKVRARSGAGGVSDILQRGLKWSVQLTR